jgi:hypothetical protein
MITSRANLHLVLLVLLTAGLLIPLGCSDDGDSVGPGDGKAPTYGSPNGEYNLTSTNVNVQITNSDLPVQLQPFIEQWISDLISSGGSTTCEISQNLLLLLKTESPACTEVPYVYDPASRSCTVSIPIDAQDIDVSSLGLCQTILLEEHCVQTVSITAEFIPNLVWAAGFATFSGSEAIGSAQSPADMSVAITGTFGGTYNIEFYASRDVSGTRCSDCATCPSVPTAPSPNGDWSVTSTNVHVTVTDSDLPTELNAFIAQWIRDIVSNGGTSEWSVVQAAVVLSRAETDMCAPMVYAYDLSQRSCQITTPVNVSNVDVSSLGLCQTILTARYCLTKISLDADFTPDFAWAADFGSFGGNERIGSAANPASATVTITGPLLGGTYHVDFYSYRDLHGTRCTPCR